MAVYKDKNGTYFTQFRCNGARKTKRGFKTKSEALKYEHKAKYEENNPQCIRFTDLVAEYQKFKKANIAPGTYMRTNIFFDTYIIPNFSNKSLSNITELDCLRFWQYLQDLEKSSGYKNDILGSFKGVFKYAEDYYRLKDNPSSKLKRFQKTREEKIRRKNRDMNIWTIDEFWKFDSHVNNPMFKMLFRTLFFTGMRKGECLALTWKDLRDHYINVDKSLSRKTNQNGFYEVKEPKNVFSIRDISLNEALYQDLLKFKESESKIAGFSEDWFIFGRLEPVAENTLTRVKNKVCDEANVKRIHIHDFRHSHASNLIADGVNIVAVSKRLGHSDVSMTLSVYTHLLNKNDDELIKNIETNYKKF